MAQLPRLGTDPASGIEWTEDRPVESPTEAATRPPQTSVTRRRAKAAAKKAEGPDPAFLELQAELRILESEVAAVETVLARELQKLRDRLKGAEEKIGGLSSAPRKG